MKEPKPSADPSLRWDDALTERVIRVIADAHSVDPETIDVDLSLEELGLDSLDTINVLFAIEEAFDVDIPDDDARTLTSVRVLVDYLCRRLSNG